MTIEQLQTFIAIAQSGGLRPASKVLNKTQPTLSASLKNLELSLGVQLIDRDSYRVRLTKAGETLYHKARHIMSSVDDFQKLASYISQGYEPHLRLAIDYFYPWDKLQPALRNIRETFPKTSLSVDFQVLGGTESRVLNGDADIGLTPFIQHQSRIESVKLFEVMVVPVAASRALTRKDSLTSIKDHLPQIVVKDPAGAEPIPFGAEDYESVWAVSDHPAKEQLIRDGFGWGYLEKTAIREELKSSLLVEINDSSVQSKQISMYLIRALDSSFGMAGLKVWESIESLSFTNDL